ncbi:ABC transporter ATP-binding protein [Paenibacillus sp. J2TS4]|uniref:ABC transporter ATP-binding protein n=1 Tax=Paenibacillus sp. J2TS4 TaxID=2807194 RepID=UPI001B1471A3|nr:ABC transporter transmembrane domain-containing protein [Paenibacillus sp. J2TS4]GIP34112.1 multidrug ABC transporter permease/ATP-binding protein [Paenibacillus sp. J2TS4]
MSFVIKLQWFFKQHWMKYMLAITLMALVSLGNMIPPRVIGQVIDSIRISELTQAGLVSTVSLLVGLAVVTYLVNYIWMTSLFGNSILLEKTMRSRLMKHWTRMTPSFFQRNRTGDLMALATNDVLAVSQTAGFGVLTLVNTVVGITVVLGTMVVFTSYKLMLAALIPLPFLALAISRLGKAMRQRFLASQEAFGRMNDQALESISGMRVIRSYVQETEDAASFREVTTDVMNKNRKVAIIGALFQPVISTIVGLSYSIGIGYGSYLVFQGDLSLGQLVTFNIYLGQLVWPMIAFGEFINILQRGSASVDRLESSLAQKADVREPAHPLEASHPLNIELKNLTFRYPGSNVNSLNGISVRVNQGETLGVVGRTGSGKSTLLKQLLRLYPVEPDRLFISGHSIDAISIDQIRSWVGYVPQEHMLLSKTIAENIALGKTEAGEEEIRRAVEMASFTGDVEQMKDGLQTIVGENGVMLSGGQKQRLAIARALLVAPEILLLDDALSAVDARTESIILRNLRRERADKTTWIATHRLSAVSHANWILVLEEGRVIEEGTHDQLMRLGGWYRQQYDKQQLEASLLENGKEAEHE